MSGDRSGPFHDHFEYISYMLLLDAQICHHARIKDKNGAMLSPTMTPDFSAFTDEMCLPGLLG